MLTKALQSIRQRKCSQEKFRMLKKLNCVVKEHHKDEAIHSFNSIWKVEMHNSERNGYVGGHNHGYFHISAQGGLYK